jgi:translation elongation factor EF-4
VFGDVCVPLIYSLILDYCVAKYSSMIGIQVLNKIDLPGAEPQRVCQEIEEVCFTGSSDMCI